MTKERLKALFTEYGRIALYTYLTLFALVLAGFAFAISWGFEVESASSQAGVFGAAYLATKLSQPLRIAATFALTPLVAQALRWKRGAAKERHEPNPVAAQKTAGGKTD